MENYWSVAESAWWGAQHITQKRRTQELASLYSSEAERELTYCEKIRIPYLLYQLEQKDLAYTRYAEFLVDYPDSSTAMKLNGLYLLTRDNSEAENYLWRYIEMEPHEIPVICNLILIYYNRTGNTAGAKKTSQYFKTHSAEAKKLAKEKMLDPVNGTIKPHQLDPLALQDIILHICKYAPEVRSIYLYNREIGEKLKASYFTVLLIVKNDQIRTQKDIVAQIIARMSFANSTSIWVKHHQEDIQLEKLDPAHLVWRQRNEITATADNLSTDNWYEI